MNRLSRNPAASDKWENNRRELNTHTREFRTVLSDIARLMQRILLKGSPEDRAELKAIFSDARQKMLELINRIDKSN